MAKRESNLNLSDPAQYFRSRFQELIDDPFNLQSKAAVRYSAMLSKIPEIGSGETILDFGCGSGIGTWMLGHRAGYVLGIDTSEPAISFARDHYAQAGKVDFVAANIFEHRFDRRFDRITMVHALEHMPPVKVVPLLLLAAKVLKPSGQLHIDGPVEASLVNRYERFMEWINGIPPHDPTHLCKFTIAGLTRTTASCGFELKAVARNLHPSKKIRKFAGANLLPSFALDAFTVDATLGFALKPTPVCFDTGLAQTIE